MHPAYWYLPFLLLAVIITSLKAEYVCQYKTGYGVGNQRFYIGRVNTNNQCTKACIRRKLIYDNYIDGATFTPYSRACYCERWMTSIVYHRSYQSCMLRYVVTQKPTIPYICTFTRGYGNGKVATYIGRNNNYIECRNACIYKKQLDRSINGISYATDGSKRCFCKRAMNRIVNNSNYKSCIFRTPKKPSTPKPPIGCGLSSFNVKSHKEHEKRIVGGEISKANTWPWQVGIFLKNKDKNKFICGGSIINKRWIVTAAHCVVAGKEDDYLVKLGDHIHDEVDTGELTIAVKKIIKNHAYNEWTFNSDIAAIQLQKDIKFTNQIRSVCLPKQNEQVAVGTECFTSGWGLVLANGKTSTVLKHLELTILSETECKKKNEETNPITKNMVCGRNHISNVDSSCKGDSGGPLVCKRTDGRWVLQGVVSYGARTCDATEVYPVFTRVGKFISWLKFKTTLAN